MRARRARDDKAKTTMKTIYANRVLPGGARGAVLLVAIAINLVLPASIQAGEFYEKDGVAIKGYDPVAYFAQGKAVAGTPEHTAEYKGSTFHFSSKENRDAFTANPEKYAPQYGGFCAYGTAGGYKAKIDPAAFTVVDDKLYLNYDESIQKKWSKDIPGFVAKADAKWPEVSRQTKVIE
jgi:YHS domain-containing protein